MRLLIIEDDRESADYLVKAFREVGHVAELASDGEEGLSMEYAPLRRKVLRAAGSPSSAARFFFLIVFTSLRDRPVALHVQGGRAMVRESPFP